MLLPGAVVCHTGQVSAHLVIRTAMAGAACGLLAAPPAASADTLGYLVNITVRPGYNFPDAASAVAYGQQICDRVGNGLSYADNLRTVKADLVTNDDYQATYLISQAVDQLCPEMIWQLRKSAAHQPNAEGGMTAP